MPDDKPITRWDFQIPGGLTRDEVDDFNARRSPPRTDQTPTLPMLSLPYDDEEGAVPSRSGHAYTIPSIHWGPDFPKGITPEESDAIEACRRKAGLPVTSIDPNPTEPMLSLPYYVEPPEDVEHP